MTRLYGRAPKGERVGGTVPPNSGENIPLWGALGGDGLQAVMTVEGAPDGDVVRTDVKRGLGPTVAPGEIVVLENLSAHQATGVQHALARRRARRRSWPPDSPDWSPLARGVSKLNTALRAAKARTREALETAIQKAMETVTAIEARNWFRHCGSVLQ